MTRSAARGDLRRAALRPLALLALLASCSGAEPAQSVGAAAAPVASSLGSAHLQPVADDGPPLAPVRNLRSPDYATSRTCGMCHSNIRGAEAMRDGAGRPVAPFDLWRSTLMANALRDPLYRAALSVERLATPSQAEHLERTCLRCHAPQAAGRSLAELSVDDQGRWFRGDDGPTSLALDGVSCSVCHQIAPDDLGTPASFSGGFQLSEGRVIYGPHPDPFVQPMRNMAGWEPVHGEHVLRSSLCASCHTLFTEAHDAEGRPVGATLPEQTPYLEWRNSLYDTERADPGPAARDCQGCHMPTHDSDGQPIATRLARHPRGFDFPPLGPRQPYGRHVFVGGNTLVLAMLRDHGEALGVQAPPEAFQTTLDLTREQLQRRTARLSAGAPTRSADRLRLPVRVAAFTGHKLPTGHPTRRVWLSAVVRDAAGRVLTHVGTHDSAGRLLGLDGRPLAAELRGGPVHPHRDVVRPDEPQVWQALMADADGAPTWLLLRGCRFLKDDRLLPMGWSADHPDAATTAPVGTDGDDDFMGGSDGLLLELPVPADAGPLRVELALHYQTLDARWAAELLAYDTPQVAEFARYWEAADRRPETLAELLVEVP